MTATLTRPRRRKELCAEHSSPASPDGSLPSSASEERAALGCQLEIGPAPIPAEWYLHPGRQVCQLGIEAMAAAGFLLTSGAHPRTLALANGKRLVDVINRSGLWDCSGKPVHEIRQCLEAYGLAEHVDHHARRLQELHLRREAALAGDRLAGIARDPHRDLLNIIDELRAVLAEVERCPL